MYYYASNDPWLSHSYVAVVKWKMYIICFFFNGNCQ